MQFFCQHLVGLLQPPLAYAEVCELLIKFDFVTIKGGVQQRQINLVGLMDQRLLLG